MKRAAIFVELHRASEPFRGRSPQYLTYVGTLFRSPEVVTLPCSEREVSAPQELSGRSHRGAPGVHRRGAKRAVRWAEVR
jgi:hypothetical protein